MVNLWLAKVSHGFVFLISEIRWWTVKKKKKNASSSMMHLSALLIFKQTQNIQNLFPLKSASFYFSQFLNSFQK